MPKGVYTRRPASLEGLPEGHKRCSRCRNPKPLDQFHITPNAVAGRNGYCKACNLISVLESDYRRMIRVKGLDGARVFLASLEQRVSVLKGIIAEADKSNI